MRIVQVVSKPDHENLYSLIKKKEIELRKNKRGTLHPVKPNRWKHVTYKGFIDFYKQKIDWSFRPTSLLVTKGQLQYESVHFLSKIKIRDPKKYKELKNLLSFDPHPLFNVIDGDTEDWEIITPRN